MLLYRRKYSRFAFVITLLIISVSMNVLTSDATAESDRVAEDDIWAVAGIDATLEVERTTRETSLWEEYLDTDISNLALNTLTYFAGSEESIVEYYSYDTGTSYVWSFSNDDFPPGIVCSLFTYEQESNWGIFDTAIYLNMENGTLLFYSEDFEASTDSNFYNDAWFFSFVIICDMDSSGILSSDDTSTSPSFSMSDEPFDNLVFSDFLYEKSKNYNNATISGSVKNNNNFAVSGYFYVVFYDNGSVVHRELVGLPTIPAHSTGTWSDIIYDLEYDRVEYADSTVRQD